MSLFERSRRHLAGQKTKECHNDAGRGMMEVIVGILVVAIVGSIFLHVIKLGVAMYTLNSTAGDVADELNKARVMAVKENRKVNVIFSVDNNTYGIDLNGNGVLDGGEAEDLPSGVTLSENTVVTFLPSGDLPPTAKEPAISLSNTRSSHNVRVSSMGSVTVE
ncbi:MAG TPA: GspH/FimT family protein [Blastocatellia bacterium]|nr:GspH/FimT family protein [Blastocatellia bacterium]